MFPPHDARFSTMKSRRLIAFLALLAVGWTALWPLISAAHAAGTSQPMPLCHMAGAMVPMDEAPQQPGAPQGERRLHCPLCIMAFYAGFFAPPAAPPFQFSIITVVADDYCAPKPHGLEVALPFGRAPPAFPIA